ncbi:deoxyribose-phosphate aldolase, partial [Pseudoalteromonas piscicida]
MTLQSDARLSRSLMDLTSLKEDDPPASSLALLKSITPDIGLPAALCVFPQFVRCVKADLEKREWAQIKVATV